MLARLIDFLLCRFASFITGVRHKPAIANNLQKGIVFILPIIIAWGFYLTLDFIAL